MNALAELPDVAFSIADAAIDDLRAEYMQLAIRDVDDREGYKAVYEARQVVKKKRVEIEKTRKALKADALEYGRKVDGEAKRLTSLLEPIESHLESEEEAYNAEKERLRQEAEDKRLEFIRKRLAALAAVNCQFYLQEDVAQWTDDEFSSVLSEQTAEFESWKKQRAEEEEARRIEAEKLAAERVELDRIRKEQAAEAAKLEAERRRIADEEAARQRAIEIEQRERLAAERARREAIEEQARKEAEAKARAAAEEAERKRIEALRPDRDKLCIFADKVRSLDVPKLSTTSEAAMGDVADVLVNAGDAIRRIADGLIDLDDRQ